MEIGDLHYFAGPARASHALSPQRRRAALLLVAAGGAVLWLAMLLLGDGDALRLARPAQALALVTAACDDVYAPDACICLAGRADAVFGTATLMRMVERTGGNIFADAAHGHDAVRLVQDCMARRPAALAD